MLTLLLIFVSTIEAIRGPPVRVPSDLKGRTNINLNLISNEFSLEISDRFLVQKSHDINLLGEAPWTCVLLRENGVEIEQNFTNPFLSMEDNAVQNVERVWLSFKGQFDDVESLECDEKNLSDGDFFPIVRAVRVHETAVGASFEFPGEIEIRHYTNPPACANDPETCDLFVNMVLLGEAFTDKEEYFAKTDSYLDGIYGTHSNINHAKR